MRGRVITTISPAIALLLLTFFSVGCEQQEETSTPEMKTDNVGELAPGVDPAQKEAATAPDTSGPVITHRATMETDKGIITIGLYGEDAPKTVENFVGLAEKGFYEGTCFHRVIAGFMVQGGDPFSKDTALRAQWGTGGESIYGEPFNDELNPESPSGQIGYREGILAMANRGPNTQTSQFFIVASDEGASHLPYSYTIFGKVLNGMETVREIEKTSIVTRKDRATGEMQTIQIDLPPNPAVIKGVVIKKNSETSEPSIK